MWRQVGSERTTTTKTSTAIPWPVGFTADYKHRVFLPAQLVPPALLCLLLRVQRQGRGIRLWQRCGVVSVDLGVTPCISHPISIFMSHTLHLNLYTQCISIISQHHIFSSHPVSHNIPIFSSHPVSHNITSFSSHRVSHNITIFSSHSVSHNIPIFASHPVSLAPSQSLHHTLYLTPSQSLRHTLYLAIPCVTPCVSSRARSEKCVLCRSTKKLLTPSGGGGEAEEEELCQECKAKHLTEEPEGHYNPCDCMWETKEEGQCFFLGLPGSARNWPKSKTARGIALCIFMTLYLFGPWHTKIVVVMKQATWQHCLWFPLLDVFPWLTTPISTSCRDRKTKKLRRECNRCPDVTKNNTMVNTKIATGICKIASLLCQVRFMVELLWSSRWCLLDGLPPLL